MSHRRFHIHTLWLLLALTFGAMPAAMAQKQGAPLVVLGTAGYLPADDNEMVVPSESLTEVIPFSRAGNLIVIQGKVDSTVGSFILDTGAPGLILNLTYFRHYAVHARADHGQEQGGITGQIAGDAPTAVEKFSLGNFDFHQVTAHRISLAHIENAKGIKILGLLGMGMFSRFEMIIDYENNKLHLHRIGKKEQRTYRHAMLNDETAYNTLPVYIKDGKLLTDGKVGSRKLTFVIDTGAESNVIDSRLSDKVFDNITISRRVTLTGTGSARVEALYGIMPSLTIAGHDVDSLPVVVTNLEKMCAAYDRCIDGMLGFEFLSKHRIGFNFVNNKMYIWK